MKVAQHRIGIGIGIGSILPLVLAALVAAPAGAAAPGQPPAARVRIRGNGTNLGETPVVVPLERPLPPGAYLLEPATQAPQRVPPTAAQVFNDEGKSYFATVLGQFPSDADVSYTLRPAPSSPSADSGVALRPEGANVAVLIDDRPVTEYLSDSANKPYYYPLIGPTGASFTRHYPMKKVDGEDNDHNHQRSLWFTHGAVNGVDFWASDPLNAPKKNFGSIKETARKTLVSGPVLGLIRTADDWLGPDGKRICRDERVVTFYDTEAARVVDFDVTLHASDGPVTFGDTKEGMFGLRVASSMDVTAKKQKGKGKITNAEGVTDNDAWGKPSPWVDYVGPVDGQTVGIAILNHPDSFRYPTTWHVRDYGLFAANPFGWHDFKLGKDGNYTLPPGESIRFRYRLLLHKGDTPSAGIPAAFRGYAKPPAIEVQAE